LFIPVSPSSFFRAEFSMQAGKTSYKKKIPKLQADFALSADETF
jgi:hypothetical protein